jgi:hypothetical protein
MIKMRILIICMIALVIIVGILLSVLISKKMITTEPYENVKIFLSIASFRDDRCSTTLEDAFKRADHPNALVVGICEQNLETGEMCLRQPVSKGEVRVTSVPSDTARGPCIAREKISRLWQGEDIVMQIDAHSSFVKGWDTLVRKGWKNRPFDKCVLTGYPVAATKDVTAENLKSSQNVPVISHIWFPNKNLPNEVMQRADSFVKPGEYCRTRGIAGGCLIMAGSTLKEVPLDDSLKDLFQGEESLYAARLYTHGFELLGLPYNFILHDYDSSDKEKKTGPKFNEGSEFGEGSKHAWDLLRETYETDRGRASRDSGHGFGNVRRVVDFFEYIKLDRDSMEGIESEEWFEKYGLTI